MRRVEDVPGIAASQKQNRGILALGEISGQRDRRRVAHSIELRHTTGHGWGAHFAGLPGLSGALLDRAHCEEGGKKQQGRDAGRDREDVRLLQHRRKQPSLQLLALAAPLAVALTGWFHGCHVGKPSSCSSGRRSGSAR